MPRTDPAALESGELVLPATSANLGPAFDAAALAFSLYLRVRAEPSSEYSVAAKGRDAQFCGGGAENLILNTYREVLQSAGKQPAPLRLEVSNEIPIGKGCGSSAAARLAGIALAVRGDELNWTGEQIIAEASRREGHPDNAAACWLGGLAIARNAMAADGSPAVQAVKVAGTCPWPLLLAIPGEPLSTEEARRVLPVQYSRADAVFNVQSAMFLLAGFTHARSDLLRSALHDRIHEPYRAPLCPLLPALRRQYGSDAGLARARIAAVERCLWPGGAAAAPSDVLRVVTGPAYTPSAVQPASTAQRSMRGDRYVRAMLVGLQASR